MTPICTRVNAESLPGLLLRLEGETNVLWRHGETPYGPDLNWRGWGIANELAYGYDCEALTWGYGERAVKEGNATLVTPNRFVELVAEDCPKEE